MDAALNLNLYKTQQKNDTLLQMLDKGIDDMEAGRELPIDEAFDKITELRNYYRKARV